MSREGLQTRSKGNRSRRRHVERLAPGAKADPLEAGIADNTEDALPEVTRRRKVIIVAGVVLGIIAGIFAFWSRTPLLPSTILLRWWLPLSAASHFAVVLERTNARAGVRVICLSYFLIMLVSLLAGRPGLSSRTNLS